MRIRPESIDAFLSSLRGQPLGEAANAAREAGFFVAVDALLDPAAAERFRLDRIVLALDGARRVQAASIR